MPTVSTNYQEAIEQLKAWSRNKNRLALRITGGFFDLMFAGYLKDGQLESTYVFYSVSPPIASLIAPTLYAKHALEYRGHRVELSMERAGGRLSLIELDPNDQLNEMKGLAADVFR